MGILSHRIYVSVVLALYSSSLCVLVADILMRFRCQFVRTFVVFVAENYTTKNKHNALHWNTRKVQRPMSTLNSTADKPVFVHNIFRFWFASYCGMSSGHSKSKRLYFAFCKQYCSVSNAAGAENICFNREECVCFFFSIYVIQICVNYWKPPPF